MTTAARTTAVIPRMVPTERYAQAVAYASAIHATQVRKGTDVSYVCHLLGVSALVIEAGGDEDQAIAGLLHDAAEDAGGEPRLADIAVRFGPRVAEIVRACSDSTDADWKALAPYEERRRQYLDRLAHEPEYCLLVTFADKVHNARAILTDLQIHGRAKTAEKFTADEEQLLGYYRRCLSIAKDRGITDVIVQPLQTAIRDIEVLMRAD